MDNQKGKISRREFTRIAVMSAALFAALPETKTMAQKTKGSHLRLGGPVKAPEGDPEAWVKTLKELGYSAAFCPVEPKAKDDLIQAYARAAEKADIVIAEVGAWSNPISPDEKERAEALSKCRESLALAENIGARCCVNISGSRGKIWDGPDPDNLTDETFEMIVETTRSIIDSVKPTRTFYTLETMPWAYPDSPDSYLRLVKAMDRKAFAVHLDPVNMISSPQRYFRNGELIRECFAKLGPYIKSCHAKDILLSPRLTTHLDEVRPGLGGLDYAAYLKELSSLPDPPPLMLEHLETQEEFRLAAEYVRGIASKLGLLIK